MHDCTDGPHFSEPYCFSQDGLVQSLLAGPQNTVFKWITGGKRGENLA